jgi:acyl carrier protein
VTTLDQLNEIFRRVFDNPELTVGPQTTADDVSGWDSLSHVNLILAVEEAFGLKISNRELLGLQNVGDLVACVERRR